MSPNSQRQSCAVSGPSENFIGQSVAINLLLARARSVAHRPSTIMVTGETGTGKELVARLVHQHSPRADYPFIAVDCSAFSEALFESQFFGHVKGAFTGAAGDTLGFVRAADGGTLFLDEIGELPLKMQAKFLRVLQERCVVPVGRSQSIPVDIRVICATHRNLRDMVGEGSFREDLYFRLHVIPLRVPPLRERSDDVPLLASFFLAKFAQLGNEPCKVLSDRAIECLMGYPWPGNIRELFNILEQAHVLSPGPIIKFADLPPSLGNHAAVNPADLGDLGDLDDLNLRNVQRRVISEALNRSNYNRAAACRLLGVEKRRLNRLISQLGIQLLKPSQDI
jgi:transcriptional regulator with PAS, ATPase and Fis domain